MKNLIFIFIILASISAFSQMKSTAVEVSLKELISDKNKFNDRRIITAGCLYLEFESDYLVENESDCAAHSSDSSLSVVLPKDSQLRHQNVMLPKMYNVKIEGVFSSKSLGGTPSYLKEVIILESTEIKTKSKY